MIMSDLSQFIQAIAIAQVFYIITGGRSLLYSDSTMANQPEKARKLLTYSEPKSFWQ